MANTLPPLAELREWLRYDTKTGEFFWIKTPGRRTKAGSKAGYDARGYTEIRVRRNRVLAHRLAWLFVYGEDPGEKQIDHINCDRGDNRIVNLRLASSKDNSGNKRKKQDTTSNLKGVSWYKRKRKWQAQIRLNGKSKHLGYFHSEQEAHAAYCVAAVEVFGKFARTV